MASVFSSGGRKKRECPSCGRTVKPGHIKQHMSVVHMWTQLRNRYGKENEICSLCSYRGKTGKDLARHIGVIHGKVMEFASRAQQAFLQLEATTARQTTARKSTTNNRKRISPVDSGDAEEPMLIGHQVLDEDDDDIEVTEDTPDEDDDDEPFDFVVEGEAVTEDVHKPIVEPEVVDLSDSD